MLCEAMKRLSRLRQDLLLAGRGLLCQREVMIWTCWLLFWYEELMLGL